ncbi:MAG TPA: hypothetical protein VMT52_17525, partial [Planctomycetota bacterium]|nr:hypothetical protein [Planctomycetota bacterium]
MMFVRWLRSVAVLGAVAGCFCMARLSGAPQDADEDLESILDEDVPEDDSTLLPDEPDPGDGDDSLPGLEDESTEESGDLELPDEEEMPADEEEMPADEEEMPAEEEEAPAEEEVAPPARERPAARPRGRPPVREEDEPEPEPPARARAEVLAPGEDIFDRLGLTVEARREEAKELVRQAKDFRLQSDLVRAEGRLVEAQRLDPQNEEVDRLLAEVRLLLGDPRGALRDLARALGDEQKVAREQARTEIHRLLNEGRQFEQTSEFSKAVDRYELAIQSIRHAPLDLRLESELRDAEVALEAARRKAKEKEDEDRRRWERTIAEQAYSDRQRSMQYLENQVRELRRKAAAAAADRDFDRAIQYYERILTILPRDELTLQRLTRAREDRHTYNMDRLLRSAAENYDLAILSIEESSVTYQRIFRYPDPKEWERISPKVVSIEEEIAASESPVEKEIKRKLEQPYEIGFQGETLADALKQLQNLSGVNFILNKEGSAQAETQVSLARLPDLRLRNVLSLLLESAGEDFSYTIKSGAVMIGPKTSLKEKKHLRFYEISDLIQVHPDFKAPPLALDEGQGRSGTGAGALDLLGLDEGPEPP